MALTLLGPMLATAPATAQADCGPVPCDQVVVGVPHKLAFDQDHGGVPDADGVGTGFTWVDPTSNGGGYLPENLAVDQAAGELVITTTAGIASASANSLDNGLGVGIDPAAGTVAIGATLVDLPEGTAKFEQAGLWFGNDEDNHAKFVVQSTSSGPRLELLVEVDGSRANQRTQVSADLLGADVELRFIADPAASTLTGVYRVGDGPETEFASFAVPPSFFSGEGATVDPEIGTATFGGLLATHRNAAEPMEYRFGDFSVTTPPPVEEPPPDDENPPPDDEDPPPDEEEPPPDEEDPPVSPCAPVECADVLVATPHELTFEQDHGGLPDAAGAGTGFTWVDPPSNGDGYLPERLAVDHTAGSLAVETTAGLASGGGNSLDNGLAVGLDPGGAPVTIGTTLLDVPEGTGGYEQAGLWFGNGEDDYAKLTVQSAPNGSRLELLVEVDGARANSRTLRLSSLPGADVALRLEADPSAGTVSASYQVDGGASADLASFSVPSGFFGDGVEPPHADIGTATFGGVFASHRNASSPLTYQFDSFSVGDPGDGGGDGGDPGDGGGGDPGGGDPCAPLDCSQVKVALPYSTEFDSDTGGLADGQGTGTGLTWVDPPTNGAGYLPDQLLVDTEASALSVTTTAGLAINDVNSQDNAVGVGFDASSAPALIETTLVGPPSGSGAFEQAGLWFGNDEDNYVKLVVMSTPDGTRVELLLEEGGATTRTFQASPGDLSQIAVDLQLSIDPSTREVAGSLTVEGGATQTLGTLTAPERLFGAGDVATDPEIGTASFAGVFASHRSATESQQYDFDSFTVRPKPSHSLRLTPSPLAFEAESDDAPVAASVDVAATGATPIDYQLSANMPWLSAAPTEGATPGEVTISADPAGLRPGVYEAVLTASGIESTSGDPVEPATLPVTLTVGDPGSCAPLGCGEILVDLPYELDFASDHGRILDAAGVGTGFTWIDPPSKGTGYIQDNLAVDLAAETLDITTTKGLASDSANSLDNGLGVGVDAITHKRRFETTLASPPDGSGKYEQAGLWFGNDEDNYVKLAVQSAPKGTRVELLAEVGGSRTAQRLLHIGDVSAADVRLELATDPTTHEVVGRVQIDDERVMRVGAIQVPGELFSMGEIAVDPDIGTATFAGVFASHRNASSPMVYRFDGFTAARDGLPELAYDPADAALSQTLLGSPVSGVATLTSDEEGVEAAGLTFSSDAPWLTAESSGDGTPTEVTFTASTDGLTAGVYTADVIASAEGFEDAHLPVTFTVGDANGCEPIACSEVMVSLPYELDWAQPHGALLDRDGTGTGFTWVDDTTNGTGYLRDRLKVDLAQQNLRIETTSGLASGGSNSLDNGLAVGIDAPSQITELSTTVLKPPAGTGSYEQAGLWFGNDEDNYVKVTVQSAPTGTRIEQMMEIDGKQARQHTTIALNLASSDVGLHLRVDPEDRTLVGSYSVSGGPQIELGKFTGPPELFSFDAAGIDQRIGTNSFGGVFASHRNGPEPLTYTFDHFTVTPTLKEPPQTFLDFDRKNLVGAANQPTGMAWGPDERLYVSELGGKIRALRFDDSYNVVDRETIDVLGARLLLGVSIDPDSTAGDVTLWATHSSPELYSGEVNSGVVSRLSGPGFAEVEHVITGLPRSQGNHATYSSEFGPDGRLYIASGGNTGGGAPNAEPTEFGDRPEQPLSAALLVADVKDPGFQGDCATPLGEFGVPETCDVETYATGMRNMYDFAFHSNGQIYGPDNGLSVAGTHPPRPEPDCTGMANVSEHAPGEQPDVLLRIEEGMYYGHPNPYRDECVFKDGTSQGVDPLPDFKPAMHSLGKNRSVNGTIEYRNAEAFCGQLGGDLLVTSYSTGNDVTRLRLSADGTEVVGQQVIAGGFSSPLPIEQAPDGTLFVGEFAASRVAVLRPKDPGCWEDRAPMPAKVLDARAVALDGKLHTAGGKTSAGPIATTYVYDPADDTWTTAADFPGVPVEDVAAVAHDGKMYVFGGATSPFSGQQDQAYAYDPSADTWEALSRMPTARNAAAIGVVDGKIHVAGGMGSDGASTDVVEIYDPSTDSWSTGPPMTTRRDNAGAGVHDGKLYVFGGRTRNAGGAVVDGTLASGEVLDPSTGEWSAMAPMPTGRRTFGVGTLNDRFQVMGGEATDDGRSFSANEEYDPATDTWRQLFPMPTPRHGPATATIDGAIHTAGGGPIAGGSFTDVHQRLSFTGP